MVHLSHTKIYCLLLHIYIHACSTWVAKQGELTTGEAVEIAIKAGYKLIDCAHRYGNEAEIGKALQKCFEERGDICYFKVVVG